MALALSLPGCTDPAPPSPKPAPSVPSPPPPRPLAAQLGAKVSGSLKGGESHSYSIELSQGQYLLAQVKQQGVDVEVYAFDPAGQQIVKVDSPIESLGSEPLPVVAVGSGVHQISILAPESEAGGTYELNLAELRPALKQDRDHAEAAILLSEADSLRQAKQTEKAAELYWKAITLQQSAGAIRDEVVAWWRLGQILNPEEALDSLKQALPLARRLGDEQLEAGILNAMGDAFQRLDNKEEARRAYRQAIEAAARFGRAPLEEAVAWNSLADLQQVQGEWANAFVGYDRALALWRLHGRKAREPTALHNLGSLYLELNRLPDAQRSLLQSLRLQREANKAPIATLIVLGQVQTSQAEHHNALFYYRQALEIARRTDSEEYQADLLNKIGYSHLELGDAERARKLLDRAAAISRRLDRKDVLAWVLANLGAVHERQNKLDLAAHSLREASELFKSSQDRIGEAYVFLSEARVARRQGDLKTAHSKMELVLERIESLRADTPGSDLRTSFLASRQIYYEAFIDVLMELHKSQPEKRWNVLALEASERTRARSVLDTLGGAYVNLQIDREQELWNRLDALQREQRDDSDRAALEREILLERERRRAHLYEEEKQSLPPSPSPLNLAQMRSLLDPDSQFLIYALGEKRSFLWLVDQRSVQSFVLAKRETIEQRARDAWKQLRTRQGSKESGKWFLKSLAAEVLGEAAGHLTAKRLIVVADGALRYIPFNALPKPKNGKLLIENHEIVNLDSPSVLALQRRLQTGHPQATLDLAVVADPVFELSDPRLDEPKSGPPALVVLADLQRSADDLGIGSLARLPESAREAAELLALVPPDRRLEAIGFAADRKTLLTGILRPYRIVHFATHGLIHPRHPSLSGVVVSLLDQRGRPQNGFLRSYEFSKLDLSADLVVLSGCETALGQEVPGEGLVGMTRGFLDVPRLVVSLWKVDDSSTADLMSKFYRGMYIDELSPSAALRQAQLSLLEDSDWSNPYYWAPFVFQGEWR